MKLILILLFTVSCSRAKIHQTFILEKSIKILSDRFLEDNKIPIYIEKIKIYLTEKRKLTLLNKLREININENNCREDQYACTFRDNYPNTIFINSNYFVLSNVEQASTLIHELHHLHRETIHRQCTINGKENECDLHGDTPYGVELDLLKFIYKKNFLPKIETKNVIKRIEKHITKS